jgi:hypothetical protein
MDFFRNQLSSFSGISADLKRMAQEMSMVVRSLLGSFFTQLQPPALELPTKE